MSTSKSPTQLLRKQANEIANTLKRAERGEKIHGMFQAKIDAARKTDVFKVGVMMDDKIITLTLPWAMINELPEAKLSDFILAQMLKEPQ